MRPLALAPRRLGPFTLARGDGYAVVGYFPRATRFDPRRGHLLYSGDSHWTRGPVYQTLTNRLREALGRHVRERYGAEVQIVLSRPPKLEMGEAASPVCFELAKQLKRPPRQIAQEIAANFGKVPGISRLEVAGGGYLNAYFDRGAFWESAQKEASGRRPAPLEDQRKIIVEHTSINPNKAAHIGHLRNAVLGDTMVQILRHAGKRVQIQNYIDNTGVQVADVVIGFLRMEQRTATSVMMLAKEPKFDYYCWDLYAKVTNFFAEDPERAGKLRAETLKALEENRGEDAEVAQVVADAIVTCHLRSMARLDIHYDLLARESEILHLKFWDTAFEMLKESGAIHLATSGKMKGCWVLPWEENTSPNTEHQERTRDTEKRKRAEGDAGENEQDKIIVRSNGTVTYVGKDIAYQLWKFGLLGKDFHYRTLLRYPDGSDVWVTSDRPSHHPHIPQFGHGGMVYNVIDVRQSYLQDVVVAGLRALGFEQQAERSIHFSYEMVALSPRCCADLGIALSEEDARKPYVEVSGRKGLGVKADDLMDKLVDSALGEVVSRHPEDNSAAQRAVATEIAMGALRYFLLKFTRNTVIAFDFQEALSFEGETGPYAQYAAVRARNIFRKLEERGETKPNFAVELSREAMERQL